jgi:hypothetical protein
MVAWAKEVNSCSEVGMNCDLQDIFGRSSYQDLRKYYLEACRNPEGRRLVTFAIYKNQSEDTFFDFINCYLRNKAGAIIAEGEEELTRRMAEREKKVRMQEEALAEGKRAIYRRIRQSSEAVSSLERKLSATRQRAEEAESAAAIERRRADEYVEDALNFRKVRALLSVTHLAA